MVIRQNNIDTWSGQTWEECRDRCDNDPNCRSFDWKEIDSDSENCATSLTIGIEVLASSDFISHVDYNYYQKTCPGTLKKILL